MAAVVLNLAEEGITTFDEEIPRLGLAHIASGASTTNIVRPYTEPPILTTDEICMVVRNPHIVNSVALIAIFLSANDNPLIVVTEEMIANDDLTGGEPAFAADPEGVLGSGADALAADLQEEDFARADENFFDEFGLDAGSSRWEDGKQILDR